MLYLKQSTASQTVLIGPFVDDTDGATAETALTIANTDIRLSKNGGNLAAKNSGGGTHDEAGWYQITLDATDTNTVGTLQLHVKVAGALMVHHEFHVLEEAIYDALIGASAAGFDANGRVGIDLDNTSGTISAAQIAAGAITSAKFAAGAINAAAIAADAIGASELATDAVNEIRDSILSDSTAFAGANIDAAITSRLAPTTAGRTLDIAATGEAGVDLGNVTGTLGNANVGWVDANDRIDVGSWLGTAVTLSSTSGKPEVDTFSISDIAASADRLEAWLNGAVTGAATGTPTTTTMDTDLSEASDDHYNHMVVVITGGNLLGQARRITDYDGTNKTITVQPPFTEAPAVTDSFIVVPLIVGGLDANGRTDVGSWLGTAVTLGNGAPNVNIASTDDIDLSATQKASVNAEVDTAIETYHLDHLLAVDYDPASKPGVATALLNELVEDDLGESRFTVNALENAPSGSGASAATIADAVWDEARADHVAAGSFGQGVASVQGDVTGNVDGSIGSLGATAKADVNAEVDTALDTAIPGAPTADSINERIAAIDDLTQSGGAGDLAAVLSDTGELQTDWANGGRLDLILDARASQTTADAIETDTQDIQSRLPAALIGGRMDSDVEAINNDTDAADKLAAHALETLPVTFSAGGSTTTAVLDQVDGAAASTTDDVYNGRILIFNNSTLDHQVAEITDYDGATKTATITAVTTAPGATHTARMV